MSAKKRKPEGFKNKKTIDLKADKKLWLSINGAALAAAAALVLLGCLYEPVTRFFDAAGAWRLLLRFVLLLVGMGVYFFLNEYIRRFMIEKVTGKAALVVREKPCVFTAPARCLAVKEYLKISFAPVLALGALLLLLMLILPAKLFWQVYIIQIINLAGAAGDVYTAYMLLKMKKDVQIEDDVTSITIWSKNQ